MYKNFIVLFRPILLGMIVFSFAIIANAQFKAGVQGSVTDNAGAVIPGAAVTLTNKETGQTRQTVTSDGGFYRFTGLAPGTYNLSVEQSAFKTKVIENIKVDAEATRGVDVVLEIGGISETVTVEADSAILQTEDANIRNTISNQEVKELPQTGRDPYELARLNTGSFW